MILATLSAAALCASPTVHDGDTIRCGAERIRIANIDAPERRGSERCNPRHLRAGRNPSWCDYALGEKSRAALARFLATGPVRVIRQGTDRYGRTLARITVNGRDAGQMLIARGLARRWM